MRGVTHHLRAMLQDAAHRDQGNGGVHQRDEQRIPRRAYAMHERGDDHRADGSCRKRYAQKKDLEKEGINWYLQCTCLSLERERERESSER